MARLLEQVGGFFVIKYCIVLRACSEASTFEKAGNDPLSSYSFIVKCTTPPHHLNAGFSQSSSIENAKPCGRLPYPAGRQSFVESRSVKGLSHAERWIVPECRSYIMPTASIGISHLPEPLLFRDALYLMQGISGKYVHFVLPDDGDKRIVFGNNLVSEATFNLWYLALIFLITCRKWW